MAQFMNREDIDALKAYVAGPDSGFANRADSTVLLHITHSNLQAKFMEIRLDMHVRQAAMQLPGSTHPQGQTAS
jgi:tubulin-folding cofactor B